MLVHFHVKNLALIEEAEADFQEGLNILTGETGAGKSILIGSVNLALGQKMSRGIIREGAGNALVELVFQVRPDTEEKLKEMGVYPEEGQVIISRRITETRSISKVNGETCTASSIRKIAELLLDIHGQHEHQSLLYPEKQMEILDDYGEIQIRDKKEIVRKHYREYLAVKKELESYELDEEQRRREISFLEYEIQEIQEAQLRPLIGNYPTADRLQKVWEWCISLPGITRRAVPSRLAEPFKNCLRFQALMKNWKDFTARLQILTACSMILTGKFLLICQNLYFQKKNLCR